MAVTNTFSSGVNTSFSSELNTNFEDCESVGSNTKMPSYCPISSIIAWDKTFSSVSSGTATTDTVNELVDTGATFQTDGVTAGMIIHNTTDDTFGIVSSVDSETEITIAADSQAGSSTTDVFPDGDENYVIYATPELSSHWAECNGQTISDADSPFNGETLRDLNDSAQSFIRGAISSGTTGGSETHNHQWATGDSVNGSGIDIENSLSNTKTYNSSGGTVSTYSLEGDGILVGNAYTNNVSTLPTYTQMVWIKRIK